MLIDILKKYKEKQLNLEKQEVINKEIDTFLQSITKEEKFQTLDLSNFIAFLRKNKYEKYSLSKIELTLKYIQRNGSFAESECQEFFYELISFLKSLNVEYNHDAVNVSIVEIDKLIESIRESAPITNLDLIFKIIEEEKLDQSSIFECMKEINKHNLEIMEQYKNQTVVEKLDTNISLKNERIELLKKYGYEFELTNLEISLLEDIPVSALEEKLLFLKETDEFSFLKNFKYKQLFITLLAFSQLDAIKKIHKTALLYNLELENILPTSYVSVNFNFDKDFSGLTEKDSFYQNLSGTYEYFFDNIDMLLQLGYDVNLTFLENPSFFVCANDLMYANLQVFKLYGIELDHRDESLISALQTENFKVKMDFFIEAGLYDYVKEHKSVLLNKDKAFFYRIYYAKENNLPIKTRYLLNEITQLNGYGINESNYRYFTGPYESPWFKSPFYLEVLKNEEVYINSKVTSNSLIRVLDTNYLFEPNVYYIANKYVSRNKVLSLFQAFLNTDSEDKNYFEGLLFSILEGLIFDKYIFDEIVLEVMNLFIINNIIDFNIAVNICRKFGVDYNRIFETFGNISKGVENEIFKKI